MKTRNTLLIAIFSFFALAAAGANASIGNAVGANNQQANQTANQNIVPVKHCNSAHHAGMNSHHAHHNMNGHQHPSTSQATQQNQAQPLQSNQ